MPASLAPLIGRKRRRTHQELDPDVPATRYSAELDTTEARSACNGLVTADTGNNMDETADGEVDLSR